MAQKTWNAFILGLGIEIFKKSKIEENRNQNKIKKIDYRKIKTKSKSKKEFPFFFDHKFLYQKLFNRI